MILIFGGAYQGKLEYALEKYNLQMEDVFQCEMDTINIDLDKKIITNLENFIFACVNGEIEAKDYLEEQWEILKDKIVICTDISQGVVPMEKKERAWREMTGRTMVFLGKRADVITRVFCGIGQNIKEEKR
ncbi:MAG: cobalamin biosynthesis protein CobU [Eubacteriales bacterium]|jgi:adenosyl cobinamide kinase/adenosyl cobinamide phosphate guanylyltransferase|nr:cobalamin biosynthesis protein CobU [Eubacteriales bacterium]